jgi:ribosome-binding protein aMBF1 (putative translation factor)
MIIRTARDFGAHVRHQRATRKMSQQTLAQQAGVSVRWLKSFEAGKSSVELGLVLRTLMVLDEVISVVDSPPHTGIDLDDV